MSDIKLWENPLFSIEERWVHANAEIFARGQTITALKEQNALLTVQVQEYRRELEDLHEQDIEPWIYQRIGEVLKSAPALPPQVKSEDAVMVGTLHINEYHEYDFVPADLITLERALPVGAYELTAAISAQKNKS